MPPIGEMPTSLELRPESQVVLAPLTSFEVGGPARYFVDAASEAEVENALAWAREERVPVCVIGGGSNVLVSDRGFDGLVLRVRVRGVDVLASNAPVVELRAGAGEELDAVVEHTVLRGWAGLECLSGIPGYIGATPIQNVGAYGQEIAQSIVSVRAIDRTTLVTGEIPNETCRFSYRMSAFKQEWQGRYVVLAVRLRLVAGGAPLVAYPDLVRELSARGLSEGSLAGVREAVLGVRRSKSMVVAADDPNRRSAGSFFVNPIVDEAAAERIERASGAAPGSMPRYVAGPSKIKLSAAWCIEHAGFSKGSGDGRVGISTRHALAIVNRGGATATEILGFAARVRDVVRDKLGVVLEHEPVLIGWSEVEARSLEW